jgi:hypothetical protein
VVLKPFFENNDLLACKVWHPNVSPVFDVGHLQGFLHYFAARFFAVVAQCAIEEFLNSLFFLWANIRRL